MKTQNIECHGLDTPERICFYEQDYYVFSNFSSFQITYFTEKFPTAEHAYHWRKFDKTAPHIAKLVKEAASAHEAFKLAGAMKDWRREDWDEVKTTVMYHILHAKVAQHPYVRKKLLASGDRELVENSWRDDYWGWGPNKDGKNMLGQLWMQIRDEIRNETTHRKTENSI